MDGPFIRAGSRSTVNERAAVYFKHEWHNEDQLSSLIYMLLSGKGTQELQLWPKPAQEKRARSENLTGRFVWKVEGWSCDGWGCTWGWCSPPLCEHSVPVIWCFFFLHFFFFTFSTPTSTSVVADYLHHEAPINPLSVQDGRRGRKRESSKLKWGMLKKKKKKKKNNTWARCYVQIWLGSLVN